ncbi:MAG: glutamate--tRNA ligase [Flexilinea sp.]
MIENQQPVRVRFAPSPTGRLHLGGGRTALYNYLLAKKTGGTFILRIEDTDKKRYIEGAEQEIIDGLHWLGIEWEEGPEKGGPNGPYRQSERKQIYLDVAERLIEQGDAYYCFCTPERLKQIKELRQQEKEYSNYDGHCRNIPLEEARRRVAAGESYVIRFKTPKEGTTTVKDHLRGEITVENRMIDDYIIVKSDGWALYHLAAMVDDHLMKITHVIRGSEWLPTLPLHHMIIQALHWDEPIWIHLSVFLRPSGKGKMSKRESTDLLKDGYSIFLTDLKDLGYIPEAVSNWISLMGWSFDDHTEIFSMEDMIKDFSLEHLNPSPAAINFSKLDYFNGVHIRSLSREDFVNRIKPFYLKQGLQADDATLLKIAPILQGRIGGLDEAPEISGFFFQDQVEPPIEDLIQKGLNAEQCADIAARSFEVLSVLPEISARIGEPEMRDLVTEMGLKPAQVFGILRSAVTGRKVSPPLFESMEIIGKEKVLERIKLAESRLRTYKE